MKRYIDITWRYEGAIELDLSTEEDIDQIVLKLKNCSIEDLSSFIPNGRLKDIKFIKDSLEIKGIR